MTSNTNIRLSVGLIVQINKLIRPSVGADSSRPSPIYRPSLDFHYPDQKVNRNYRIVEKATLSIRVDYVTLCMLSSLFSVSH